VTNSTRGQSDTYKGWYARLLATLHELAVALEIRSNEDNLSTPKVVCILDELHHVWTLAPFLAVPEAEALWLDVIVDELGDGGTEGLLLVRADPDQIPIFALDARRQRSAEPSAGADADTALIQS
jgi:hypothetical protein